MSATFAAVFAGLYAAHQVADHWVQTDHQAAHKGCDEQHGKADDHADCTPSDSRRQCLAHVATYGATQLLALGVLALALDLRLSPLWLAVGMAINLGTHYLADRRTPLRWIAEKLGSGGFYRLGAPRPGRDDNPSLGTGAYALDQSWHIAFLFITAIVVTA